MMTELIHRPSTILHTKGKQQWGPNRLLEKSAVTAVCPCTAE